MDEIITIISNVGFPIAICCFVMMRIDSKLSELTLAIKDLSDKLEN